MKKKEPPIIISTRREDDTGKIRLMINDAFDKTDRSLDDLSAHIKQSQERFRQRAAAFARQPKSQTILVVEDYHPSIKFFTEAIRSAGYETVVGVTSLAEAREALRSVEFGLVMLDLHLPNGDGWELAKILPRTTSIILTSALITDDLDFLGNRLGAAAVMRKPVEKAVLVQLVREILGPPTESPKP